MCCSTDPEFQKLFFYVCDPLWLLHQLKFHELWLNSLWISGFMFLGQFKILKHVTRNYCKQHYLIFTSAVHVRFDLISPDPASKARKSEPLSWHYSRFWLMAYASLDLNNFNHFIRVKHSNEPSHHWFMNHQTQSEHFKASHTCLPSKTVRCSEKKPEEPKDYNSNGRWSPETGVHKT